jgi:hypothetical protein
MSARLDKLARGRMVKRAEVARFLGKDASEIDRMIEQDGMPHLSLPGPTKPSVRFFLRDLHGWLLRFNRGCEAFQRLEDFETAFREANQETRNSKATTTN